MQRRVLASGVPSPQTVLVWNPGQGHLPVWLMRASAAVTATKTEQRPRFTLLSRDALQLLAARANLCRHGIPKEAVALHHQAALHRTTSGHDLALLHPDDDLPTTARDGIFSELEPLVNPSGHVVLYGGAPSIAPLLARRRPFTLVRETRRRALRVAILGAPRDVT